ncbi:MAG: serine hydroxymethyltransferase [Alphaproteobacteria bacterium]
MKNNKKFFEESVYEADPIIAGAIKHELARQQNQIELIASENITSRAVLSAQGSVFTNKYAEGYPGKRYYGGCEFADVIEQTAIDRLKELYNCNYANVQPNSGSQANQGVFTALIKPGDTILGQALEAGGHLTHGAKANQSGKWFNAISYGVKKDSSLLDYAQIEELAHKHKPKLIIAGFSAYPRIVDWKRISEIAKSVGAFFMVDMAHIAGLVAGGAYPSPVPYADVVTSTTHKTLRGPRGGIIISAFGEKVVRKTLEGKDITLSQAINSAVFPGIQGGPLVHVIAAKAVSFKEALEPEFKTYAQQVIKNARVLAKTLIERGVDIITGGTDNHIVLVDLRPKGLTGKLAEHSLEMAGLTCNKNAIPFDPEKPTITSGIRLGTPAGTTRGFKEKEFEYIGNLIGDVFDGLAKNKENNSAVEKKIHQKVVELCKNFPIYTDV